MAPQSAINTFFDTITATTPLFIVIVFFAIIRIGGKPILDLKTALAKVDWLSIVFLAGILMISTAMGEETTGIPGFISNYIVPLAEGKSAFALVAIIAVISCVLTNIANNIPVGIILVTVSVPLAISQGSIRFYLW